MGAFLDTFFSMQGLLQVELKLTSFGFCILLQIDFLDFHLFLGLLQCIELLLQVHQKHSRSAVQRQNLSSDSLYTQGSKSATTAAKATQHLPLCLHS